MRCHSNEDRINDEDPWEFIPIAPRPQEILILNGCSKLRVVHEHWRSPQECVDHILCMPTHDGLKAKTRKKHAFAINMVFTTSLCMCCLSLLLFHMQLSRFLVLCIVQLDADTDPTFSYYKVLHKVLASFFFHPKGFRMLAGAIAMQSTKDMKRTRSFHLLCAVATLREDRDLSETFITASMRALYITMEHWTQHNFVLFIQNYLIRIQKMIKDIAIQGVSKSSDPCYVKRVQTGNLIVWNVNRWFARNNCMFTKTQVKMFQTNKSRVPAEYDHEETVAEIKKNMKRDFIESVQCSWHRCSVRFQSIQRKTCSECQLVFYCSRSCQKRSWRDKHRHVCAKLTLYRLWRCF